MRISVLLIIFLVLFNAWGALLQEYHVDDHLGISAGTGDAAELEQAQQESEQIQTGENIGQTLLGYYNSLLGTVEGIVAGWQPGVQLLVNIVPPGIGEDLIIWGFGFMPIVIAIDLLAYARGVDL